MQVSGIEKEIVAKSLYHSNGIKCLLNISPPPLADIPATHSMDTSSNTKLSTAYYQTRNTRRAHNTTKIHNIDNNTTHETTAPHIGSCDTDTGINKTFLASHTDNSNNILQNISLSFDPTDMHSTTCE